jgi:hypothetical protein
MTRRISKGRKNAYYVGSVVQIIGVVIFFSCFVLGVVGIAAGARRAETFGIAAAFCGVIGFGLILLGSIIQTVGARGLAGSGVVLNPEKARDELEPYSRQAGGMVKDALDEAGISLGGKPEKIIMIKCRACGRLNEEDSKFCQECGKPM